MKDFLIKRFPILRKLIWIACLIPLGILIDDVIYEQLGANPVEKIERHLGLWTLIFICITLSVSPIVKITKQTSLIVLRRTFGLYSFFLCMLTFISLCMGGL